jgi:hypothetical protein
LGIPEQTAITIEGDGDPPVVIVPTLGSSVLEWVRVLRAASAEATVCAYDRAGLGFPCQVRVLKFWDYS